MRRIAPLFVLISIAIVAPRAQGQQATAVAAPTALDSLRPRIRHLIDSLHAPSLAIAVAQHGKIIWEEGFGLANIAQHTPATANTLYSMASISKPITATGIMTLVQSGRVALDHPANEYLGRGKITGYAGDAREATVARVMSHTAGLPLHYRFFYEGFDEKRPSMDDAIARYAIVVYPPGKVYNYANLDYGIVEQMIAHVSGESYESFMRRAVFAPLGMTRTAIGTGRGLTNAAVRYDDSLHVVPFYDFDHRGASAVWTTAHELVRFGMFHMRDHLADMKPILADSTITQMQHTRTPGDTAHGYALGWLVDDDHGFRRISHTGGMPGVSTVLHMYPAQDLAVVVLSNQTNPLPFVVASQIENVLLPGRAEAMVAERTTQQGNARPSFAAPADLLGDWSGTVRTYQGTIPITVRVKADEVLVRLGAGQDALWSLVNWPRYDNQMLEGAFVGDVPTPDAMRYPHNLALSLFNADGKLRGFVASVATNRPDVGGAVSSYAELIKQ
ncbi:MAG: serine hydrolase domain-containing protein [Gemmatimonadaceae bacterium]